MPTGLILKRTTNEKIILRFGGKKIGTIFVHSAGHNWCRLGFDLPPELVVDREELDREKYPAEYEGKKP